MKADVRRCDGATATQHPHVTTVTGQYSLCGRQEKPTVSSSSSRLPPVRCPVIDGTPRLERGSN